MRAVLLALASLALPLSVMAADCGADLKGAQKVESSHYVVAYRTLPGKIVIGKHFAMDFAVCPKGGNSAVDSVQVDAQMPEHGHGMNYKARIKPSGAGRFHAEGMMVHMPGRWELTFDLKSGSKMERLTQSLLLE